MSFICWENPINSLKKIIKSAVVLQIFLLILAPRAYCYLDPGTGSYFFQILVAGLFGALYAAKIFSKNIKEFLNKLFRKESEESED